MIGRPEKTGNSMGNRMLKAARNNGSTRLEHSVSIATAYLKSGVRFPGRKLFHQYVLTTCPTHSLQFNPEKKKRWIFIFMPPIRFQNAHIAYRLMGNITKKMPRRGYLVLYRILHNIFSINHY
jgi:hypothetical protein